MPRLWPSPQAMSAPWLPGFLNRPKASGSLKAATQSAPPACARSANDLQVLDRAEEVRRLHGDRGDLLDRAQGVRVGRAVRAEGQLAHLDPGRVEVGPHHAAVERVHGARHGHGLAAGHPHRHEQRLGQGGGAVVHRGVGHLHAEQAPGERLVLEDRLQGALAHLRLVGGVGGHELGARGEEADGRGDEVLVAPGAQEDRIAAAARHAAGQFVDVGVQLPLGHRLGQHHRARAPALGRDDGEKVLERAGPGRGEHRGDVLGGVRQVAHGAHPFSLATYASRARRALASSAAEGSTRIIQPSS